MDLLPSRKNTPKSPNTFFLHKKSLSIIRKKNLPLKMPPQRYLAWNHFYHCWDESPTSTWRQATSTTQFVGICNKCRTFSPGTYYISGSGLGPCLVREKQRLDVVATPVQFSYIFAGLVVLWDAKESELSRRDGRNRRWRDAWCVCGN